MKICLYIGSILSFLLEACAYIAPTPDEDEQSILRELILLRTQGLMLAEIICFQTENTDIRALGQMVVRYYEDTHPEFLEVCKRKLYAGVEIDVDALWSTANEYLHSTGNSLDDAFLLRYQDNIVRAITLHEMIILSGHSPDLRYFSFVALPELYRQQRELSALARENRLSTSPCMENKQLHINNLTINH